MSEPAAVRQRILAVDDQPENLELLGAILEDEGFDVVFATNGIEAIEAVAAAPPHAILLDVMMPRMDGFAVCRRLRSQRPTCFIPIVLLTALTDVASKVRGLEAGADDFLNKPFHRVELLARLRSLLRIRNLRDELDSTENVMFSMIELLEGKDPRTRHHSLRVAALASTGGRRLGLDSRALQTLGYREVTDVRVGKCMEVTLGGLPRQEAEQRLKLMCEKLLANTVIEDFRFEFLEE